MLSKVKRDFIYLRLSEEDEDNDGKKAESNSISSQRVCIRQYLKNRPELGVNFEEIVDDGYSGTNFDRPGMHHLLELIEAGCVGTIIVRDLSRFARNYLEAGYYLEVLFPSKGIRFIAVNDGFDSDEPGDVDGLELAIRNLVNQMYSRDISKKIKSAVDMKKRNGEYAFGAVPYGYKKGELHNSIVIDPPAAEVVRYIFQLAVNKVSITKIAIALNEKQIDTPSVYLANMWGKYRKRTFWTYESVRNILNNRIYTGDTEIFKSHVVRVGSGKVKMIPEELREVLPGTHDAIISRSTFFLARATVKRTACKTPTGEQSSPFTSYLKCGCCGNRLAKGKVKNKTWLCANARYARESECQEVRMDDGKLREMLLYEIQRRCEIMGMKKKQVSGEYNKIGSDEESVQHELSRYRRSERQNQQEKMNLYEKYVEGTITKAEYLDQKKTLIFQGEELSRKAYLIESHLNELRGRMKDMKAEIRGIDANTKSQDISDITPTIMKELIKEIIIYPEGKVHIEWNK